VDLFLLNKILIYFIFLMMKSFILMMVITSLVLTLAPLDTSATFAADFTDAHN
jgi:hypothetical protein